MKVYTYLFSIQALTCYHCNLVEDPASCNTTSQCKDGEVSQLRFVIFQLKEKVIITPSKVSYWSPYNFKLVLKVKLGYAKYMLL